jgi:hypothetical protein
MTQTNIAPRFGPARLGFRIVWNLRYSEEVCEANTGIVFPDGGINSVYVPPRLSSSFGSGEFARLIGSGTRVWKGELKINYCKATDQISIWNIIAEFGHICSLFFLPEIGGMVFRLTLSNLRLAGCWASYTLNRKEAAVRETHIYI